MHPMNSFPTQQSTTLSLSHESILKKIDNFFDELNTKLKKEIEAIEINKIQSYKDQLAKTKNRFNQIKQKRCQFAIKNAVYSQKKNIQKQCLSFLQKSEEVNQVYEKLKQKLMTVSSTEQELSHEIDYLQKHIKAQQLKYQILTNQLKSLQQWNTNKQQNFHQILQHHNPNISSVKSNSHLQHENQIQKIANRTQQWKQNSQRRLKYKIANTKQFINNLTIQQSTLEKLFNEYNPQLYADDKKKLNLIEHLLNQPNTKLILYSLLFKNQRK